MTTADLTHDAGIYARVAAKIILTLAGAPPHLPLPRDRDRDLWFPRFPNHRSRHSTHDDHPGGHGACHRLNDGLRDLTQRRAIGRTEVTVYVRDLPLLQTLATDPTPDIDGNGGHR